MDNPQNTVTLGKDVWNVADGFTKFKILKWMIMLDKLEMVAIYGCEDIEEQLPNNIKLAYLPGINVVRLRLTGTMSNDWDIHQSVDSF